MIGPATDVKNSEILLSGTNLSVNASSSDASSGGFSERLKDNIAQKNSNKIDKKEDFKANNQNQNEVGSKPKQDVADTVKPKEASAQSQQADKADTPSEFALPGGKSLPDKSSAEATNSRAGDDVAVANSLGQINLEQTEQDSLQGLIQPLGVKEQLATSLVDPEIESALPLIAPLSTASASVGADIKLGLPKAIGGGVNQANSLTAQLLSATGQVPGAGIAFDALLQKSPFDLPNGLLKASFQASASTAFSFNEALLNQNDLALPKSSAMSRIEPTSAYASTLVNPLSEFAANIGDKLSLDRPITHARWSQDLGERVQWMMNRSMNGAEIRLNPPQLGPMEVRIQMNQDQASVAFASQHANVREALEAALPRLREMLGQQSLNLVNVDISQHSFSDQRQQEQTTEGGLPGSRWSSDPELISEEGLTTTPAPVYEGLINTYV